MANQDRWRTDRDDDRNRDDDDNRGSYSGDYPRGSEDRSDWNRSGSGGYGRGSGWEGAAGGYGRGREFEGGGRSFGGSSGRGGSFGGLDFERDSARGGGRSPAGGTDWEGGTTYRGGAGGRSDSDRNSGQQRSELGGAGQNWRGGGEFGGERSAYPQRSYSGGRTSNGASSFGETGRYGSTGGLGGYGRSAYARDTGNFDRNDNDRGFFEKAADEVYSWFGDDDAERRRERDHKGRGPKGYARSDDRIREDVSDRLTDDWRVDASEITVEVSSGEITLSGTVNNRDDKRRAEDIAERVAGVKHVQNNLRVNQDSAGWAGSTGRSAGAGATSSAGSTSYGSGSSGSAISGTSGVTGVSSGSDTRKS